MKLFRSIFMAVILISPTLAWADVVKNRPPVALSNQAVPQIVKDLCVNGKGSIDCSKFMLSEFLSTAITNAINCSDGIIGTITTMELNQRVGQYCDELARPRSLSDDTEFTPLSDNTGIVNIPKDDADDADTKSTDASDKKIVSHTFSVSESVNNLSGLTKKVAAETAYRQYLGSKYCDGDGTITIRSDSTQILCSNGWGGGTQPTDSQFTSEHKKALCYAECAGKEREYVSGTYGKCECSVTRAEKRAANQQARDERKAARAEDRAARQEERADERAARQEERKKEKAVECDGRNPPMDIKQNDLGLWVCVDTDETIKKREEERKTNKTLDAFWNEMEDLERAFNKRVRQLQRQAKKDGGAK